MTEPTRPILNGESYLFGKVEVIEKFNDKEHEVIFNKLDEISKAMTDVRLSSVKAGARIAALISAIIGGLAFLANIILTHIQK